MTVEFRSENPAGGTQVFTDGLKLSRVLFFIDALPRGTPTTPFDTFAVGGRYVIAVDVWVKHFGIELKRLPRRGVANPPPESIQHTFYNATFKQGLQVIIPNNNGGRLFPL